MKDILRHLFDHQTLGRREANEILMAIGSGQYTPVQISAFLTVFQMRSITVDELLGFRDALLDLCIPVDLSAFRPIDLCGTGGDGRDTFNISTLASFVVAGAGVPVAKHGNYGVSSVCGSSNVLEFFGYQFTNDPIRLERQLAESGICFLHAPLFHPAMKHVAPVRRELSVKTFFNMLGPLVNPAQPPYQLVGVYSLELARLYQYLLQNSDREYTIVHALDGYDEISLTGPFKVITRTSESIFRPADLSLPELEPHSLFGGTSVRESADIFLQVLQNTGTPAQSAVVIANAGLAIHRVRPHLSRQDALSLAQDSLDSGRAFLTFQKLLAA